VTAEQERHERRKAVLYKLRKTEQGETICLADWEVQLLLEYIEKLKGAARNGNAKV
jgi:hypothetical protein